MGILFTSAVWAQSFSSEELIGQWEFVSYVESETPDQRNQVNVVMVFQSGGTLITKMATGDVESSYWIDGNTIYYSDARG